MSEVNEYEAAARIKKARVVTQAFIDGGFTPAYVRQMEESDWDKLAKDLGLKKTPSQPTRDIVIANLEKEGKA